MGISLSTGIYYGVSSDFFNTSSSSNTSTSYLSDYASIKNGTYRKLMKAYYNGNSNASKIVDGSNSAVSTSTDKKNTATIRDDAAALKNSALELQKTGSKSLFNKVTKEDEDGNKTTSYDMDSIYKAVSTFVDDYNSLIKSADSSSSNTVTRTTINMINNTKANSKMLADVGITINSDYTLSVDEKTFKAANGTDVKSLFNGTGSYGYSVSASAAQVYHQSVSQLAQMSGSSYSSSGSYNYNYSGSSYSKYL